MIGLGRLVGVQIEPLISDHMFPWAPGIMILAMSIYMIVLWFLPADIQSDTIHNKKENKQSITIVDTIRRGRTFICKSNYFALFGL